MTLHPSALEAADAVFRVLSCRKGFDHIIGEIKYGDPETWDELREAVGSAAITAYLAALDAAGWQLVPKEPDDRQIDAMHDAIRRASKMSPVGGQTVEATMRYAYRLELAAYAAALSAAPKPGDAP